VGEDTSVYLLGGDGHDRLRGGVSRYKILRGGDGDDHLAGGRGHAQLEGQAGRDVLIGTPGIDDIHGGGGRDRLFGRGGSDRLTDGDRSGATGEKRPGPDLLDAGSGLHDQVSYARRRRPLSIDLRPGGTEGESGEGDRVVGVEDLIGGRGADRLIGNSRANFIDAGEGSDRVAGGRGDDVLFTKGSVSDPRRDTLACGRGRDQIAGDHPGLYVAGDCERFFSPDGLTLTPYPRAERGGLAYRVHCPEEAFDDGVVLYECSGSLKIRETARPRRLLAVGRYPSGRWRRRHVTLRLTPAGRRYADDGSSTFATVIHAPLVTDRPWERRWVIRFRASP
jgi:hypothetical protein